MEEFNTFPDDSGTKSEMTTTVDESETSSDVTKVKIILGGDEEEEDKTEDDLDTDGYDSTAGCNAINYFDRLSCLGLEDLKAELIILLSTRDRVQDTLKEVAFTQSSCFSSVEDTTNFVDHSLNRVYNQSNHLPDVISSLCDSISSFSDSAQEINIKWKTTSNLLLKHQELLEFLELPSLIESCVKTGCYEEALKLFLHVSRIYEKNCSIPLINCVYQEAAKIRDSLSVTLLNELKKPCQLPTCIKLVSLIKKLALFDEVGIRLKFLSYRDIYLESVLKGIPSSPPLMHLSRFVDAAKVNMFDIATQYKAIFPTTGGHLKSNECDVYQSKILASWLQFRVDSVVAVIQDDLVSCIENEPFYPIDDMIDPCFYFGLSLSRIGCDIRPRLIKIFSTALLRRLNRVLGRACNAFDKELNELEWRRIQPNMKIYELDSGRVKESNEAPFLLVQILPLASLLNSILSALNEIHVNSSSLLMNGCKVRDSLNDSLVRSTQIILSYCRRIQSEVRQEADVKNSRDFCEKLCTLYVHHFLPHVSETLSCVFPTSVLAKSLGVSAVDFTRLTRSLQEREGVLMEEEDENDAGGGLLPSFGINYLMQINAKAYLLDNYLPKLEILKDEVERIDTSKLYVRQPKETSRQASLEEELLSSLKSEELNLTNRDNLLQSSPVADIDEQQEPKEREEEEDLNLTVIHVSEDPSNDLHSNVCIEENLSEESVFPLKDQVKTSVDDVGEEKPKEDLRQNQENSHLVMEHENENEEHEQEEKDNSEHQEASQETINDEQQVVIEEVNVGKNDSEDKQEETKEETKETEDDVSWDDWQDEDEQRQDQVDRQQDPQQDDKHVISLKNKKQE